MTHGIYSRNQLESQSLATIKKLARQIGAEPTGDKRVKDSWIEAILAKQPQPVSEPAAEVEAVIDCETESFDSLTLPYTVSVNGEVVERFPTYMQAHRHCQVNGYLVIDPQEIAQGEFERDLEVAAETIAPENPELTAYDYERECFSIPVFMGEEPELNDDYLFHDDPQPQERGSGRNDLPRVGDFRISRNCRGVTGSVRKFTAILLVCLVLCSLPAQASRRKPPCRGCGNERSR